MCEVVDISDDEDSPVLETNVGFVLKDEIVNYNLPPQHMCSTSGVENVASSSGTNLRSSFIGMGFAPSLVNKVIEENGEQNAESLLEILFTYSDLQQPKSEFSDDCFLSGGNDCLAANLHASEAFHKSESSDSLDSLFGKDTDMNAYREADSHVKMEPSIGSGVSEEKMASLLKMNFSLDEVRFAMDRLGKHASIDELVNFIFAARMAKKYEKDANNPFSGDENCNNEALFGIMDKTLRLLEMGFTENQISAVFERCGSEAPLTDLAESIITGGTEPDPHKYSSPLSKQSVQVNCRSLKRKTTGDFLMNQQPLSSVLIKTEEYSSDVVPEPDLLERLKGKRPKEEHTDDEPNNWLKPKEEFMEDTSNSEGRMWLEARRGISSSTNNRVAASRRRVLGILEDRNPTMSMPNPCKSLTSVVAKPPYFFYGNVTSLSQDSWARISQFLYSSQPEFANTQLYSALSRKEGYIHNLPIEDRFHIHPKGPMTIEEAIPHSRKWWPSWDDRKQLSYISCETSGVPLLCDRIGRILADCNGLPSAEQRRQILQQCREKNLIWVGKYKLGRLEPEHLERIMGYPFQHSQVVGFGVPERLGSLKHSFQTDTLGYHLSVLRRLVPGGVVILSFFSGIGGVEIALHRLGIVLKGVVSVETCEVKRKIMKKWWESSGQSGELIQIEDINKLCSRRLEDLMKKFKGFDLVVCQNPYSAANSDNLSGLDFSMFAEFVRVVQRVRSTMDGDR